MTFSPSVKAADNSSLGEKVIEGGMRDFQWPVSSSTIISSCFLDPQGHSHKHLAIDIAGSHYSDVTAAYDGTVVATDSSCSDDCPIGKGKSSGTGFGNYVVIEHKYTLLNGDEITLYSRYSHLSSVSVTEGTEVTAGTKIGTLGSTGCSYGYHLDFQICYGGWEDYKTCSIDPYVNQLLEIPDGLTASGGATTQCCFDYVDAVNEIYEEELPQPVVTENATLEEIQKKQLEEKLQEFLK